jgi:hypothetical protein
LYPRSRANLKENGMAYRILNLQSMKNILATVGVKALEIGHRTFYLCKIANDLKTIKVPKLN